MKTAASAQPNVFLCEEGGREEGGRETPLPVIYGGEGCKLLTCAEIRDEEKALRRWSRKTERLCYSTAACELDHILFFWAVLALNGGVSSITPR